MNQKQLIRKLQKTCNLTDQEAANYLKYSIHTIRQWKCDEFKQDGSPNPHFRTMSDSTRQYIEVMIERF